MKKFFKKDIILCIKSGFSCVQYKALFLFLPAVLFIFSAGIFAQVSPRNVSDICGGLNIYSSKIYNWEWMMASAYTTDAHDGGAQWVTMQTAEVPQPAGNEYSHNTLPPVKLNIDQVRNGSASSPVNPATWVNGNAGASNAHYVEGYSIPYRVIIENLSGTGPRSVDIEWDIRHSGANALDFITNFNLIDFPAGSHVFNFGHTQETINPLPETGTWASGTAFTIPAPNFGNASVEATFNAIQGAGKGQIEIWNGNITGLSYISQGSLNNAQSSTRLRIFFTNTAANVIISWGGHIAKAADWGMGNSAAAVSGSPYHTRLIEWDADGAGPGSPATIGNQDRSLSADAVVDPPLCEISGNSPVACSTTQVYSSGLSSSDLAAGVTFDWSLTSNTCLATISDESSVSSVTISTGTKCNCTFTVKLTLFKNGQEFTSCSKVVTVQDTQAPTITCPAAPASPVNCPATPVFGIATATDNCGTPTITTGDVTTAGTCAGNYTVTRKWTATDACGNTAICSQSVTVQDVTAPTITSCPGNTTIDCPATPSFGTPTATDACSTPSLTFNDATTPGSCANNYSVTRTFTFRDACGNTATCSQTITVRDITAPGITFCPANTTIDCPATPSFGTPTATDACATPTLTYSDASSQGTCANNYSVTRTFTFRDACGNTATCSQTITVRDITAPGITFCPANTTIDCPATPSFGTPEASDACATPTLTHSDASTPGTCANNYSVTRTFTFSDACGNTATCSQTITVRDITAPQITCPPDVTVDCAVDTSPGAAAVGQATATDACGSSSVTSSDQTNSTGCVTVITRTWTATDACGNTAICVQHIIQKDLAAPVITCNDDGSATASDNCGSLAGFFLSNGVWTAIDASGNISTANCPVTGAGERIAISQQQQEQAAQVNTKEEKNKAAGTVQTMPLPGGLKVEAFPNPFTGKVKFAVTAPQPGYSTLEIMNMLGQKIKTVYRGHMQAGSQVFEITLPAGKFSTLLYIFRLGEQQVSGKLVQTTAR